MMDSARDASSPKRLESKPALTSIAILLAICSLVLLQGGFFTVPVCVCGIACLGVSLLVTIRKRGTNLGSCVVPALFLLVGIAYLASSVANGVSLTTLSETGFWSSAVAVSFLASQQTEEERSWVVQSLAWFGMATGLFGLAVYSGVMPLVAGVDASRLQFTFQYANAAGIWYAICTVLCLLDPSQRLCALAALPATALLLTESGGAILAFCVVALCLGVGLIRVGKWDLLLKAIVAGMIAVVSFGLIRFATGSRLLFASIVPVAASAALHLGSSRMEWSYEKCRKLALVSLAMVGIAIASVATLRWGRVVQASGTLVERFFQMRDGMSLWSQNALLGVGPDNWKYLYRYIQTAQYNSTVNHSSCVQILLDGGFFAAAPLVAACLVGARRVWARRKTFNWVTSEGACIALIALHSLVDFDLEFGSLLFLLAFLVSWGGEDVSADSQVQRRFTWLLFPACLVGCAFICLVGLLCEVSTTALSTSYALGEYDRCRELVEHNSLAHSDAEALEWYLGSCIEQHEYEPAAEMYGMMSNPTDNSTIYAAVAYYSLGDSQRAGSAIIGQMHLQPYNVPYFNNVKQLISAYGLDESLVDAYNEAIDYANMLADRASESLPEQQRFDRYSGPLMDQLGQEGVGA